ncbi:hypothetical protein LguiB_016520 [Lonicera macranthoides]
MLTNKSRPVIGKLIISSGYRTGFATSPRSPLEMKIQSPAVGLGILAALENSGDAEKSLCGRNLSRSDPIPVGPTKDCGKIKGGFEETEIGSLEDYTYVTCHRPDNKSYTTVYSGDSEKKGRKGHRRGGFEGSCVFDISPAILREPAPAAYPTSDFLRCCNLCQKKLDGKDIYIYRGEKAFCSTECRSMQIAMDERASSSSSSSSSTSRSVDVSNSPYTKDQIFFSTGILAI